MARNVPSRFVGHVAAVIADRSPPKSDKPSGELPAYFLLAPSGTDAAFRRAPLDELLTELR
jgi:hypothetical protein